MNIHDYVYIYKLEVSGFRCINSWPQLDSRWAIGFHPSNLRGLPMTHMCYDQKLDIPSGYLT